MHKGVAKYYRNYENQKVKHEEKQENVVIVRERERFIFQRKKYQSILKWKLGARMRKSREKFVTFSFEQVYHFVSGHT